MSLYKKYNGDGKSAAIRQAVQVLDILSKNAIAANDLDYMRVSVELWMALADKCDEDVSELTSDVELSDESFGIIGFRRSSE